ncbi:MAG TPA: hypothetical protein VGG44_06280 [Tepidisphaeraceae bacterium]|jgi:hypothetical protein
MRSEDCFQKIALCVRAKKVRRFPAGFLSPLLLCISTFAFSTRASGQSSVGVYDENVIQPNTVDFEATGNTLPLSRMEKDVQIGFPLDDAGVLNGDIAGLYSFGADQTKSLEIYSTVTNQSLSVGYLGLTSIFGTPISGYSAFSVVAPDHYFMGLTYGALPGEHITEFGLTVLSNPRADLGIVYVSVDLSDGTAQTAERHIAASNAGGDTFYGFAAPQGVGIAGFSINTSQVESFTLRFDDIGFVTSALPEPSALGLLVPAILMTLRNRWGVQKPRR